jgi:hypothetical protein
VARVDVGAVGVVGEQRFVLLVPWMSSPPPGDVPGAAVRSLVARVVGNANGVRWRSCERGLLCEPMAPAMVWDERGEQGRPHGAV